MELSGRRQAGCVVRCDILCDPCKGEDEEENASFYCTVCKEFLCDACAKAHRRAKVSKHQHLLDRDRMPKQGSTLSDDILCTKHNEPNADCFCSVCDVEQAECTLECMDDTTIDFTESKEYIALMDAMADLNKLLQNKLKMFMKKENDARYIHMKFVSKVKAYMSEIDQILDSMERRILEEAESVRNNDIMSASSASKACVEMMNDIEEMSSNMDIQDIDNRQRQVMAIVKKAKNKIKQIESITHTCQIKEYTFRPNEAFLRMFKDENNLGTLEISEKGNGSMETSPTSNLTYLGEVNIQHSRDTSAFGCRITGGVMVDNDILALADHFNSSVKTVDISNDKVMSSLQLHTTPWDITRVERDQIVVTCRNKLVFIKVGEMLSVLKEIKIDGGCGGIVYTNKTLIVYYLLSGCVNMLDLDGNILTTITNETGKQVFDRPFYIALSIDQKTIYLSDTDNNSVSCMDIDGIVKHVHRNDKLKGPFGMAVDKEDNVYIAGTWLNAILILSSQSTTVHVLQDGTPGTKCPRAVIYCAKYNRLYVSHTNGYGEAADNSVSVYQIE